MQSKTNSKHSNIPRVSFNDHMSCINKDEVWCKHRFCYDVHVKKRLFKTFSYKKLRKKLSLKTFKKSLKTVKKYTTFRSSRTSLSSERNQSEYSLNTGKNNRSLKRSCKLNKEFSTIVFFLYLKNIHSDSFHLIMTSENVETSGIFLIVFKDFFNVFKESFFAIFYSQMYMWRDVGFQRDSNPWLLRQRCSALPTEL